LVFDGGAGLLARRRGVAFVVVAVREQMARFWRIVVDGGIWQKGER